MAGLSPHYADDWLTIWLGDCRAVMAAMEPESVNCVVTSPPYFGLRDYGTATWDGGDAACDHMERVGGTASSTLGAESGGHGISDAGKVRSTERSFVPARVRCRKCGAVRIDAQIGLEPTPDAYVAALVAVFREVRRVLRRDGTVWLNLGDSYSGGQPHTYDGMPALAARSRGGSRSLAHVQRPARGDSGLKPKDRMMMPARVALALRDDGWWLRDEIVWAKPNPMPSSVGDRTTPAHEMVYLLTRSGDATFWTHRDGRRADTRPEPDYVWRHRETAEEVDGIPDDDDAGDWRRINLWSGHDYYYDADAIREASESGPSDQRKMREGLVRIGGLVKDSTDPMMAASGLTNVGRKRSVGGKAPGRDRNIGGRADGFTQMPGGETEWAASGTLGRNKRSVWTVATQPYPEAHFATFPEALITPMILAGCPPAVCAACATPVGYRYAVPVRSVRSTIPGVPVEDGSDEVLQSGVLGGGASAGEGDVRGVWGGIHAGEPRGSVLQPGLCEPDNLADQGDHQGVHPNGEGLHRDLSSDAPDGDADGLRVGAQVGDGRGTRPDAPAHGGRRPHQHDQGRQPSREPASADQESPRRSVEQGPDPDGEVSGLRESLPAARSCGQCGADLDLPGAVAGGVVLDCFGGSGTVAVVSQRLGRRSVLIDLKADYVEQMLERIGRARAAGDGPAVDMPAPFANDGLWGEVPA